MRSAVVWLDVAGLTVAEPQPARSGMEPVRTRSRPERRAF